MKYFLCVFLVAVAGGSLYWAWLIPVSIKALPTLSVTLLIGFLLLKDSKWKALGSMAVYLKAITTLLSVLAVFLFIKFGEKEVINAMTSIVTWCCMIAVPVTSFIYFKCWQERKDDDLAKKDAMYK